MGGKLVLRTNSMKSKRLLFLCSMLLLVGAGCSKHQPPPSPTSFARVQGQQILATDFAKICWLDPEAIKTRRSPIEHSRTALKEFIVNVKFQNNMVNDGYWRALGLPLQSASFNH